MTSVAHIVPEPPLDMVSHASRHIHDGIRQAKNLAIVLIHVHGIERLYATHGHSQTSALLEDFRRRLGSLPQSTFAEQLSDRKYALVFEGLRNTGHIRLAAQKVERLLQSAFDEVADPGTAKLNMGIVTCPDQGKEASELLRCAEMAVLDGRRRNESIFFYAPESADSLLQDWGLERRLDDAMVAGDLELYYQPKIDLRTDSIAGAEALLRWREPELGDVSPDVFIEVAESTGKIIDLTHFAIQRACRQIGDWKEKLGSLNIAVNITPSIIGDREIIDVMRSATNIWGVEPGTLTIEVTENALMADRETSHRVLTAIREFGARVSIDDFGTGYSSMAYLKEIPADELKIDRSFVMGMLTDSGDYKIVDHTIQIAKSFGLSAVAEGVESDEVLHELKKLGCDYAQGYSICRPVPPAAFADFCLSHNH